MSKPNDNFLTVSTLWHLCVARWKWFAASVLLCLFIGVWHILTVPYLYSRSASVMVLEDVIGNNATDKNSKDFNDIGFLKQKNNVTDVARHFTSLDILMEVAKRMGDNVTDKEAFEKAKAIQGRLSADIEAKGSAIINFVYQDSSTGGAERVLTLILNVYNEKWIMDKQKMIQSTSRFIETKMQIIKSELNLVDDSISSYKSRHGITDLTQVSNVYLQQQSQADADILKLMNQKAMAEYIRSLLEDESTQRLLLVNSGINNTLIESQITLYNNLLLQMQSHMEYTSGQNPLITNLEKELKSLRKNILSNVINHIRTIDIQLRSLEDYHRMTAEKISSNPNQSMHLVSIEREQKVKESLYLYLLQKKEETEISLTYQQAPTRIIDLPHGSGKPTSPKRVRVLFASLLIGFFIPLTVIFCRVTLDESVRGKFDIDYRDDISFLGEIPTTRRRSVMLYLKERFRKSTASKPIVVGADRQDPVNEAFRIIRTRLEHASERQPDQHVYMVTSSQSGTGKTFVAMNLSLALALVGKRVLYVDADLRKGTASRIWKTPERGLSDYLDGRVMEMDYLYVKPEGFPTLDIMPSGAIPSNPTELLNGNKMVDYINIVRPYYDYIIIDTPKSSDYADAEIISSAADCSLNIIRAGMFKRADLDYLKEDAAMTGKQLVILNGVSII